MIKHSLIEVFQAGGGGVCGRETPSGTYYRKGKPPKSIIGPPIITFLNNCTTLHFVDRDTYFLLDYARSYKDVVSHFKWKENNLKCVLVVFKQQDNLVKVIKSQI